MLQQQKCHGILRRITGCFPEISSFLPDSFAPHFYHFHSILKFDRKLNHYYVGQRKSKLRRFKSPLDSSTSTRNTLLRNERDKNSSDHNDRIFT